MKTIKKILAVMLCVITVALCFAGCSSSGVADEITASTMLIAYTEENAPFIYEENGELKGFDVEIFQTIFNNIKNDYKNYKFVKVDSDYRLGEDAYCVDKDGKECIAYIMIGGIQKDKGDINRKYTFTNDIITNYVKTITKDGYGITDYTKLTGKDVGVIKGVAKTAFDKHSAIKNACKSVKEYDADKLNAALDDLDSGKIKALVVDDFSLHGERVDGSAFTENGYNVLNNELDHISYAYAFKKWDWYADSINEAIYELQSEDYNDADQLTPIVEKYFGYDASRFDYIPD